MAILLVDDERRLRQALGRALTAHGHTVHEVGSRAEAVAACAAGPYDVLVLDVNLPDATGWDVLRDNHASGRAIPAIVVSAVPPSAARIREFRPAGVLHKPFPIDALLRLVQEVGGGDDRPAPPTSPPPRDDGPLSSHAGLSPPRTGG